MTYSLLASGLATASHISGQWPGGTSLDICREASLVRERSRLSVENYATQEHISTFTEA